MFHGRLGGLGFINRRKWCAPSASLLLCAAMSHRLRSASPGHRPDAGRARTPTSFMTPSLASYGTPRTINRCIGSSAGRKDSVEAYRQWARQKVFEDDEFQVSVGIGTTEQYTSSFCCLRSRSLASSTETLSFTFLVMLRQPGGA
jgi:hypothetical protein